VIFFLLLHWVPGDTSEARGNWFWNKPVVQHACVHNRKGLGGILEKDLPSSDTSAGNTKEGKTGLLSLLNSNLKDGWKASMIVSSSNAADAQGKRSK